ncbi:MAG: DUF1353 domain-containing protein [Acidimicrobiia bacterium]|nr:DUF1353 domain-containing protein [Acidimicrobiia bacterium]
MHDLLWRTRTACGEMRWVDADGVFRRAMRELEVPFLRRWTMWTAVRWAALLKPRGREGWLDEFPRVLLTTLIAAPFVLPPAAVIVVALALFLVFELLVYVPLRLGARHPGAGAPPHGEAGERPVARRPEVHLSAAVRGPPPASPLRPGHGPGRES